MWLRVKEENRRCVKHWDHISSKELDKEYKAGYKDGYNEGRIETIKEVKAMLGIETANNLIDHLDITDEKKEEYKAAILWLILRLSCCLGNAW